MAAAQAIFFPQVSAQTLHTASRAAQTAAMALADEELIQTSSKKRKSGPMLVSRVNAQPKASQADGDYMAKLAAYMTAVLIVSTEVAKNQSQMSQNMTQDSQAFVAASKQQVDEVGKAVEAQQQAIEQAANKSWLQRVISAVVGAVLTLVGALTLQPELMVMGVTMLVMTAIPMNSNGDTLMSMLNSKLASSGSIARIFEDIGIAVGMAIVTCGASGGLSAAMGGEEAAVEGVAEAGSEEAAEAGAADAVGGAEEAVGNEAAAAESSQASSFAGKALKAAVSKFRSQLAQMTLVANPFTDIAKAAGASDANAGYIGMSCAISMNIASAVKGAYNGIEAATNAGKITENMSLINKLKVGFFYEESTANMMAKLEKNLGPSGTKIYKGIISFLKISNTALMLAGGTFGVQAGEKTLIASDRLRDMGAIQAAQVIYTNLIGMMNGSVQDLQGTASALNENLAMMNSRWDAYVAPYQTAVEVMG